MLAQLDQTVAAAVDATAATMPHMVTILVALGVVILSARAAGALFIRLGQPAVVGEICAGVLLGPSLLPQPFIDFLFPLDQQPFLLILANLGLVLFMFIVGLELDVGMAYGKGRAAVSVSISSILLPFALGIGLAALLADEHDINPAGRFWPFALFLGAAMSVTAFPVLARILTDRNMHRTETGALALACAAVDDVLAWTLLAVVFAISGGAAGSPWQVALAFPFAVVVLVFVRPQLARLAHAYDRAGRLTPGMLGVVLIGLMLSSAATEYFGVHFIFGAFLWGAIMPRQGAGQLRHEILVRLERISVLLLLPVFFLYSGLQVNVRMLTTGQVGQLVLILVVAVGGKYAGAFIAARFSGIPSWQARALGILMNTRGLTAIVILNVGLGAHLIGQALFTMLVVVAIVTTMMTGPLLRRVYPDRRVARDIAEAERRALGAPPEGYRALVLGSQDDVTPRRFALALAVVGTERPVELLLSILRRFGSQRLEVGSGLTDELAVMAEALTAMEALVDAGAREGVKVTVLTKFSRDVVADAVAQVESLAPDVVVVGGDDEPLRGLPGDLGSKLLTVVGPDAWDVVPEAIRVRWRGNNADDDAALLVAARMASTVGAAIVLDAAGVSQRRLTAMHTHFRRLGLEVWPGTRSEVTTLTVGPPGTSDVDIIVAAECDAEPVDWPTVELGQSQRASTVPDHTPR